MAAKTGVLERLRACHKEAQAAIRTALEVDETDGGALARHCSTCSMLNVRYGSTWLPVGNGGVCCVPPSKCSWVERE